MVNIINDWDILEENTVERFGSYQLVEGDNVFEIRVNLGKLGYMREFSDERDPLLAKILAFCQRNGYARVSESVPSGEFFR